VFVWRGFWFMSASVFVGLQTLSGPSRPDLR
jgi:hypothetical protein